LPGEEFEVQMNLLLRLISVITFAFLLGCSAVPKEDGGSSTSDGTLVKREFNPTIDGKWIGNGISYGAYRDGEGPDGDKLTSKENILEDLQIVSQRWNLIRMYGYGKQSRNILEVIRDNNLPIRVMQGAWISSHQTQAQNDEQVNGVVQLANEFTDIVVAVNIGNEIFVDWSWHRIDDMDMVIDYIRDVRSRVKQPVSVNDDYNFWNKPQAKRIADEVDFIGLHAYAFWNNKTIDIATQWTVSIYEDIQIRFPDHVIAFCETGWPTSRIYGGDSYEGGLIGKAAEDQQKVFFDEYDRWVNQNQVISLLFEAFDEQWKGGFDGENPMDKAEKHWGLYNSDRSPKKAVR
jgi:exo-beta-1,3-glucanase (GH17 family)